jgi:ferredoxin--NADP+ reductase
MRRAAVAKILENKMLVPNLNQIIISAPEIAGAVEPGQFIILRTSEDGERIPLTISDWDRARGTITLVYQVVGKSTQTLSEMEAGDNLPTVAGPLGNAMPIDTYGHVVCVGGCYGNASIYPIARALKEKGNRVTVVIEARSAYLLYWMDKLKAASHQVVVITRDGSKGLRGHIGNLPQIIEHLPQAVDRVVINGCNYLMMRGSQESQPLNIRTIVSLNTLMIDGTGMCGVCRVTVASSTKFACVDGPHFDGHEVNWDELTMRRKAYLSEEAQPFRSSKPQP